MKNHWHATLRCKGTQNKTGAPLGFLKAFQLSLGLGSPPYRPPPGASASAAAAAAAAAALAATMEPSPAYRSGLPGGYSLPPPLTDGLAPTAVVAISTADALVALASMGDGPTAAADEPPFPMPPPKKRRTGLVRADAEAGQDRIAVTAEAMEEGSAALAAMMAHVNDCSDAQIAFCAATHPPTGPAAVIGPSPWGFSTPAAFATAMAADLHTRWPLLRVAVLLRTSLTPPGAPFCAVAVAAAELSDAEAAATHLAAALRGLFA